PPPQAGKSAGAKPAAQPPSQGAARPLPAPRAPVTSPKPSAPALTAPVARAPAQEPQPSGFGVLDVPLDNAASAAPAPRESSSGPLSPASGFRTSALRPARPEPAAAVRPPAQAAAPRGPAPQVPPPAPSSPGDELPDQRIRQIYAKYVETKRATQES